MEKKWIRLLGSVALRWLRFICYQDSFAAALPAVLTGTPARQQSAGQSCGPETRRLSSIFMLNLPH